MVRSTVRVGSATANPATTAPEAASAWEMLPASTVEAAAMTASCESVTASCAPASAASCCTTIVTLAPSCVTGGCTPEIESDARPRRRWRRSEAVAATMAEATSASVMKACHGEG